MDSLEESLMELVRPRDFVERLLRPYPAGAGRGG